ncbi:MAG TPA: phytanoyl-CoA dioxygenase family protein [Streptosporangiaceae bacterium]|nr:phytanoyl-CoA dioxygenase family protein [Streptosporangiaceae bacterium]
MTGPAEILQELERSGDAVLPRRMDDKDLAAAREELGALMATAGWGSGFDGTRTKRVWALLARTRCMDRVALDRLVLDVVEQAIGPSAQFSLTYATQVHPGQGAQALHYEQGIYPLPRDRDVMLTAIWALDDVEMPAGSVLLFSGRLYHGAGANTTTRPRFACCRSGFRSYSASTSHPPISGSSTASIPVNG